MLKNIRKIFLKKKEAIEEWFQHYSEPLNDPIYCSLDIRNAGFKIGPVDANIFPGGWNNLCPKYTDKATKKMKKFIEKHYPGVKKILIIPENHTRNLFYLSNVKRLEKFLTKGGFEVRIGTLNEELGETTELKTAEGEKITEYKIYRENKRLIVKAPPALFDADLYILNNDLSVGMPEILKDLEIPLNPTPLGGWHNRRKSDHFYCYNILIEMFAHEFEIDPWLISSYFTHAEGIDFSKKQGLEKVAEKVSHILQKTEKKYAQYGIRQKPYVFIKNEAGTYGMAVTSVETAEEVLTMNNDKRKKMNIGKGNVKVSDVIIQEGIPTVDRIFRNVAEPVMYLVDNEVVGGFFRVHGERDEKESLNIPGMTFTPMCLDEIEGYSNLYEDDVDTKELMYLYSVIARLTSIATGYEIIGLKES